MADPLPDYWQRQRSQLNAIGDQACLGSREAFDTIVDLAMRQNDPVAKHELAWVLVKSHCKRFDQPRFGAFLLIEEAAKQSYPISQYNHGVRLLMRTGNDETERKVALCWIFKGIEGGYGVAAAFLSKSYLFAQRVGFNPAFSKSFYLIAKAEQVQNEEMKLLDKIYPAEPFDSDENHRFLSERLSECEKLA